MPEFYHIDRQGHLKEGDTINLVKYNDIHPDFLQSHVDFLFQDGVSSHGERYYLKGLQDPRLPNPQLEILFEYIRQAHFPDKTSRFQAMFAFETENSALEFKNKYCSNQGSIWRIQSDQYFKGNMKLLKLGGSILMTSYFAHEYWRGNAGPEDIGNFWEILLFPPIQILNRIS
ncbi:MAG: DUF2441 domain-containing protein [Pseudomonadota bacterium]